MQIAKYGNETGKKMLSNSPKDLRNSVIRVSSESAMNFNREKKNKKKKILSTYMT